jgi:DNA helicase-2/ATP-dependent DNA helicase PcrA
MKKNDLHQKNLVLKLIYPLQKNYERKTRPMTPNSTNLDKLLKNLNNQQRQAVEVVDRPLRIVAGAGSGKTRVITTKIAYLIEHEQIKASKILALTFTNKAAREMKERVQKLVNDQELNPFISTFHSFCARVLREEAMVLG